MHDREDLYRRVPNVPINFVTDGNGNKLGISSAAFGDRSRRPSVDRAWLRSDEPRNSQLNETDCVVGLLTGDVRTKIDVSPRDVDVVPDPVQDHETIPDNPAHALIVTDKAFDTEGQFKRLKRQLAKRCACLIPPAGFS